MWQQLHEYEIESRTTNEITSIQTLHTSHTAAKWYILIIKPNNANLALTHTALLTGRWDSLLLSVLPSFRRFKFGKRDTNHVLLNSCSFRLWSRSRHLGLETYQRLVLTTIVNVSVLSFNVSCASLWH